MINTWRRAKLGEISAVHSGSTPPRANQQRYYADIGIPWIKTMDLNNRVIFRADEHITNEAIKETSCRVFPKGTVLVAMYGGFKQIGRTGLLGIDAATNQAISSLQLDSNVAMPEFVLYWLNAHVNDWKRIAASSRKDPNITRDDVCNFLILLPPLVEQEKIVDILSNWDRAIDLTTQLILIKQQRKQGLMLLLLTGKKRFANSQNWSWRRIGDLFCNITRFESWDDEKTYIQAIVRRGSQGIEVRSPLLGKQIKTKNLQVIRTGDFLISNIQASYGAMSMVGDRQDGLHVSNVYTILVPRNENRIYTPYFDQLSRTSLMRHLVAQSSNGFKAERIRLSFVLDTFLQQNIYLPDDLVEQKRIADVLGACDNELALLNSKLELLKKQKQGLMQQLLTGKVRVKT